PADLLAVKDERMAGRFCHHLFRFLSYFTCRLDAASTERASGTFLVQGHSCSVRLLVPRARRNVCSASDLFGRCACEPDADAAASACGRADSGVIRIPGYMGAADELHFH